MASSATLSVWRMFGSSSTTRMCMAGPTTDRVRVLGSLLWHTRAGKGNRADFSVVGAEPAQRLVQDVSRTVGDWEAGGRRGPYRGPSHGASSVADRRNRPGTVGLPRPFLVGQDSNLDV